MNILDKITFVSPPSKGGTLSIKAEDERNYLKMYPNSKSFSVYLQQNKKKKKHTMGHDTL